METRKINGICCDAGTWPLEPGRPTILFIHGATNSRRLWSRQLPVITGYANTLALDLPGHGKSEGPGMDTISAYADPHFNCRRRQGNPSQIRDISGGENQESSQGICQKCRAFFTPGTAGHC